MILEFFIRSACHFQKLLNNVTLIVADGRGDEVRDGVHIFDVGYDVVGSANRDIDSWRIVAVNIVFNAFM